MLLNPFVEGLLLISLGIGCYVGGSLLNIAALTDTGALLVPLGVGYMGGQAAKKAA